VDAILRAPRLREEPIDRRERGLILVRRERVRAAVEDERPLVVPVLLVEVRGALREARGRRLVARELLELGREDVRQALLGVRDPREALELGPDALVGEVLGEELRRHLEGLAVVLLLLLLELDEAAEHLAALLRVLARLEAHLEGAHHLAP